VGKEEKQMIGSTELGKRVLGSRNNRVSKQLEPMTKRPRFDIDAHVEQAIISGPFKKSEKDSSASLSSEADGGVTARSKAKKLRPIEEFALGDSYDYKRGVHIR
jgi:hypothetical protein